MRLFTALTGVALLVVLAGCGSDQSGHNTTTSESNMPFEVVMDDTIVATCDRIRTHTHAMVECMDNDWNTVGYFSTERVNVVRQSSGY